MKIILIHTYITSDRKEILPTLCEPLGLISLTTYIESQFKSKVDIKILDLYAMGFNKVRKRDNGRLSIGISDEKEIIDLIKDENPEIVGIQCNFTGYANDAMEVAKVVKKALPDTVIVVGGAHASHNSENILNKHPYIDYIIRGEGEITFYEFIKAIRDGSSVCNIHGITYRDKDGNVFVTSEREIIKDINVLPIPDRKYLDMKMYAHINRKVFQWARKYPAAVIMASRGCPYNCIFCSTKNMWMRRWRERSPENIIREIEELITNYGVKEICFSDDQFFVEKKWVHEICDIIIEKKYNISLSITSGVSIWLADEHLLRKMKKAGFYHLNFPIESGNLNSIRFIGKPIEPEVVLKTIKFANKLGFWTSANFLIGFPYETKKEIMETINFAYTCGVDFPDFLIATPLPGAEMYNIYKKEGLIKDETETDGNFFVAKCNTLHCTAEELMEIRSDAAKGFFKRKLCWYLKPSNFINYLFPKVSSLDDMRYFMKLLFLSVLGKYKRDKR
ncbi:MAG: radical SAM protein [Elusimicrobiota bacterium]